MRRSPLSFFRETPSSWRARWPRVRTFLLFLLPLIALVLGMRTAGWLERPGLWLYDQMTHFVAIEKANPHLTVIGMTDDDLRTLGDARSARTLLKIISALRNQGASAILLVESMSVSDEAAVRELASTMIEDNHVLLMVPPQNFHDTSSPLYALYQAGLLVESVSSSDVDAITRRVTVTFSGQALPAASVALAQAHLRRQGKTMSLRIEQDELSFRGRSYPLRRPFGEYQSQRDAGYGQILITSQFWNRPGQYSYSDLLAGRVPTSEIAGKAIVVANTAESLAVHHQRTAGANWFSRMQFPVSLTSAFGASELIALENGQARLIWGWPRWAESLWITVWIGLSAFWLMSIQRHLLWVVPPLVLATLATVAAFQAMQHGLWLPLFPVLLGLALSGIVVIHAAMRNESELKLLVALTQSTLDETPTPTFVKDGNGRLRLVNRAMCNLLERDADALIGQSLLSFWPEFADLSEENATDLHNAWGKPLRVHLALARLPTPFEREPLLFGLVLSAEAKPWDYLVPESKFIQRLCDRSSHYKRIACLLWVQLKDLDDVRENLGTDVAEAYQQAFLEILREHTPLLEAIIPTVDHAHLCLSTASLLECLDALSGLARQPVNIDGDWIEPTIRFGGVSLALPLGSTVHVYRAMDEARQRASEGDEVTQTFQSSTS